jgi:hypothetical protein
MAISSGKTSSATHISIPLTRGHVDDLWEAPQGARIDNDLGTVGLPDQLSSDHFLWPSDFDQLALMEKGNCLAKCRRRGQIMENNDHRHFMVPIQGA